MLVSYLHQPLSLLDNPAGQSRHGERFVEERGRSISWQQGSKSAGSGQECHEGGGGFQVMTVGVPGVELLPWSDGHHVGAWDRSCWQCKRRGTSRLWIPQIWILAGR